MRLGAAHPCAATVSGGAFDVQPPPLRGVGQSETRPFEVALLTGGVVDQHRDAERARGTMALLLNVNGVTHEVDVDPATPLLWVVRDSLGLTGTKFSCGIGQCGACTLHVDGQPVRSCSFPVSLAVGKAIKTIEGVAADGLHPVQRAWIELDAPQCGYCQSGMIMSALALLERNPAPTDADIDAAVTNACRCSSYHRVRKAIHLAAELMKAASA